MILQFVLVRPLCSFAVVLFLVLDIYGEGSFAPNRGTYSTTSSLVFFFDRC
jgi:hypothetical protein